MGLTDDQVAYIVSRTGCDRANAGAHDYVLKDLEVEVKKETKKGEKKNAK